MRKEDKGKTGMQSVKGGVYSKMQEKGAGRQTGSFLMSREMQREVSEREGRKQLVNVLSGQLKPAE